MAKFQIPLDGQDPNDPQSQGNNVQSEQSEEMNTSSQKTVSEKASNVAKSGVSNTVDAVKKNGINAKAVAADAAGKTAKDGAKEVLGDNEAAEQVGKVAERTSKVASTVIMAKGLAASASSAAAAAGAVLIDPITWIIALVILVVIVLIIGIIAGFQVIGKTDNADGCYGIGFYGTSSAGGASAIDVASSADSTENATTIADWGMTTNFEILGNKPMTREQIVGVIGNMWQESKVNPAASQSSSITADSSNADVMALGKGNGGKAIGLIQWDSERRYYLAQYAESQGKHWSDMGVQLSFMQQEFDGTAGYPGGEYNSTLVVSKGFTTSGESVAYYVQAWEESFTRAGKPMLSNRIEYANAFNASYSPGTGAAFSSSSSTGNSGGSCLTSNSAAGAVDTSDTVNLAVQISYQTTAESKTGGDQMGTSKAKPEYVEAKKKAQEIGSVDGLANLYASCDRAVATVVINTMDTEFPWGNVAVQRNYMEDNPNKWQKYTSISEAKAGDVWITNPSHDGSGHAMMFLGNVNGTEYIMHASYSSRGNSRVAALQERSAYVDNSMTDKNNRNYWGYHYVGG